MKLFRKRSFKKSFKARTTGKLKRSIKRKMNPFYGKKGIGFIKNPRKSIRNAMYKRTTIGVPFTGLSSTRTRLMPKRKAKKSSTNVKTKMPQNEIRLTVSVSPTELARGIIDCLTMTGVPDDAAHREAQALIDAVSNGNGGKFDLQEMYLYCIDNLVGTPKNKDEQLLLADLYNRCHSEYTLFAINAYEKYMLIESNQALYPYATLGQLYERAQDYDQALKYYEHELEFDHDTHFPYLHIAEVYRKMNRLDDSINWMKKAKEHPLYKNPNPESIFMPEVVDNFLKDYEDKKSRGYVFRKRSHKPFLPVQS